MSSGSRFGAGLSTTTTTTTTRGVQGNSDESARGLLVSPNHQEARSPAYAAAPSSSSGPSGHLSPYNNSSNKSPAAVDPFDTYDPIYNTPSNGLLLPPRVLTPLQEENDSFRASSSSYRSSTLTSSTMTNSHWLDIPIPVPSPNNNSNNDGVVVYTGAVGGIGGDLSEERRSSSKYSVSAFLDSYGARAASVIRKMDLIVPVGGVGDNHNNASASTPAGQGQGEAGITRKPSTRNRDSPTLGAQEHWGLSTPSPPPRAPTRPTAGAAPSSSSYSQTTTTTGVGRNGGGLWNVGGGSGAGRGGHYHHMQQPGLRGHDTTTTTLTNSSSLSYNNRF